MVAVEDSVDVGDILLALDGRAIDILEGGTGGVTIVTTQLLGTLVKRTAEASGVEGVLKGTEGVELTEEEVARGDALVERLRQGAGLARDEAHSITVEAIFKRNGGIFEGGGIGVGDVEAAIA